MDDFSHGNATREKILGASRDLFNAHGIQGAALFKIAARISISPGNLTYHFKAKTLIVSALVDRLEEELSTVLAFKAPSNSADLVAAEVVRTADILKTMWRSRFFFNSAAHLTKLDRGLSRRLRRLQIKLADKIYRQFLALGEFDQTKDISNSELRLISDNVSSTWLHWLRLQNIATPNAERPSNLAIRNCLEHQISLVSAYFKEDAIKEMRRVSDRLFGKFVDKREY